MAVPRKIPSLDFVNPTQFTPISFEYYPLLSHYDLAECNIQESYIVICFAFIYNQLSLPTVCLN
jgi:hypothetical protein